MEVLENGEGDRTDELPEQLEELQQRERREIQIVGDYK